jgi:hypothetical protein
MFASEVSADLVEDDDDQGPRCLDQRDSGEALLTPPARTAEHDRPGSILWNAESLRRAFRSRRLPVRDSSKLHARTAIPM